MPKVEAQKLEKKRTVSSTLLGSVTRALQIELTNDRLTGKKDYIIYLRGASQK